MDEFIRNMAIWQFLIWNYCLVGLVLAIFTKEIFTGMCDHHQCLEVNDGYMCVFCGKMS